MNLLFLLLPICAFCFSFEEIVRQAQAKQRYGKISAETKANLLKIWGMDPEARKARLQRIAKKAAQQLSETSDDPVKSRISKIPKVMIEKPKENNVDLLVLNNRLGVSEYLFQGDLDLTEEQLNELDRELDANVRSKRQAWKSANKWTNNTVYFYFDDDINEEKKEPVYAAQKYMESHTCITFLENRTAKNRIRVFNGSGCWSNMGMIGGEQRISYGKFCDVVGTAFHEFAHSLGFDHTHSRSDRDNYLTIEKENIEAGRADAFKKLSAAEETSYSPFEYGSVMHYAAYSFAKEDGLLTMVPKDEKYIYTMGNGQISFYDYYMINKHYGCDAKCPAHSSAHCKNGGYPNPRDCSKCNCPAGYGGDFCDQRPSGCGETFTATSEWQKGVLHVGDEKNDKIRNDFDNCNYWITAPEGKKIEVNLTSMENAQCQLGCRLNGIEIKTENNTRVRSPLICCEEFEGKIFKSALNPTPLVPFNRFKSSTFHIAFRFVDEVSPQPKPTTEEDEEICEDFMVCNREKDCSSAYSAYCAKTCGFCRDSSITPHKELKTTSVTTTTEVEEEICEDFMVCDREKDCSSDNWYCAKTCGLCGGAEAKITTASTAAEEEEQICEDFMVCDRERDCSSSNSAHCAKTCGHCSGSPTTTTRSPCLDKNDICSLVAEEGCGNFDQSILKQLCPKSCGYCGNGNPMVPRGTTKKIVPGVCEDRLADVCIAFKNGNSCPSLSQKAAQYFCSRTCGFCVEPTTAVAITTKSEAICEDYLDCRNYNCANLTAFFAKSYCSKTCGLCKNRCEDAVYCDKVMTKDNCANMRPEFAMKYCGRSCGYCT